MTGRRRLLFVTGTRAEYGLLYWTMKRVLDSERSQLQIVATGAHLSPAFGRTVDVIRSDGFNVDAEVDMLVDSDSNWGTACAIGLGTIGMANALRALAPDLMVVLGDRYEVLAAAQAAYVGRVPIAHIHGGEVTRGSLDEGFRHAVTKLASLHFVSSEEHRRRVVQLGEQPQRVHNVGAVGLENIARLELDELEGFERRIGRRLGRPAILMTYHPATACDEDAVATVDAIASALEGSPGATIIATGSNADPGGRAIDARLRDLEQRFPGRLIFNTSLGQRGYLSAMRHCDLVLGNSSSGLIEAPSMGKPTVNVGQRQAGRQRAPSVIDCAANANAIRDAVERALSPAFLQLAARRENPYASAGLDVSRHIVDVLESIDPAELKRPKGFFDVSFDLPAARSKE
jgi:UDP-hydrolysing UDP-N-acetyl-D-glucosamine 2-epimerase